MLSYTLVLLVISSKLLVLSYPNGAPNSACESLLPVHGVPPQLGYSLQYIVEVDRDKLPENGRVQIILKSPHIGYTISGFMVQARTVMDQCKLNVLSTGIPIKMIGGIILSFLKRGFDTIF